MVPRQICIQLSNFLLCHKERKAKTTIKRGPAPPPPDLRPLVAPVILGRAEAANTYSGTPCQSSSGGEDEDDYTDEDEDLNFDLMSDVVYASLRVLPQKEEPAEGRKGDQDDGEDDDEDDDDEDDDEGSGWDSEDAGGHGDDVAEPERLGIPVPAPRTSRLVSTTDKVK